MKKLTPTILFLIIFSLCIFSFGQDSNIQQCIGINEAMERLACYDSVANRPAQPEYCSNPTEGWRTECGGNGVYQAEQTTQPEYCSNPTEGWRTECGGSGVYQAQQTAQPSGGSSNHWHFEVVTDVMKDGVEDLRLSTTAIEADSGQKTILTINCGASGMSRLYINWGIALRESGNSKRTDYEVTHRVDSNPPKTNTWFTHSDDNETHFFRVLNFDAALNLIKEISSSQTGDLFVRVSPKMGNSILAKFDVSGLSTALNQEPRYQRCGL